jgi:hypothetical protein
VYRYFIVTKIFFAHAGLAAIRLKFPAAGSSVPQHG